MKTRKSLAVIVAALLAVAPVSAPFVNNNNSAQVVQASRRHVSHRTYYTHTRNWVTKHYYDKRTGSRNWIRLRRSGAWQRAYKKSIAEVANDTSNKCYNYNNPDIIQQIKAFDAQTGSVFPTNHAAIYLVPYTGLSKYNYKRMQRSIMKAAHMWEPEFHFTLTNSSKNANVFVYLHVIGKEENCDGYECDCDFEPETHKMVMLDTTEMNNEGYDWHGIVYVIAHELGHAIGLPHDTNLNSVMNTDDSDYDPINDEDFEHYQASWVTSANKRAVEELYNEN